MLKNFVLVLLFSFILLLSGCDVEKTITIENAQPDELFLQTFIILKAELPNTKISLETKSLTISYNNPSITEYPSNLKLSFIKNKQNTDILIYAKETDENKVNNLKTILNTKYTEYLNNKISQQEEENTNSLPLRRIDLAE